MLVRYFNHCKALRKDLLPEMLLYFILAMYKEYLLNLVRILRCNKMQQIIIIAMRAH